MHRRPVQIKIFFDSMLITKRVYLFLSAGGFLLLGVVGLSYHTIFGPGTWLGDIIMREGPWFYDVLPWFLGFAATVELIEVFVVLRKFKEREEFLRRERGDVYHETNE
ncbi:MAG: hypothetical protein HUJ26_17900 [Planctomycetaceae bacterium]|nr:hypothetical protein [Planctomycetaceae bacterium]